MPHRRYKTWLNGKRNSLGGLTITATIGGASGRKPARLYPGPWKDWLANQEYFEIPPFIEANRRTLRPYEGPGMIEPLSFKTAAHFGAAHKHLPNWAGGLNLDERKAVNMTLIIGDGHLTIRYRHIAPPPLTE